jgi:acetylornithine deacetylase/succinyl-diaminopimelate desuccinylase-like protein
LCFLNIIKILKKNNALPLSLILIFDSQEEIGSPVLLNLLENEKGLFKGCYDAYYPSIKQSLNGSGVLKLGYKSILSLSFKVYSKNKEPHSAFSAMIPNPASEIISLLNSIYSKNGFQIKSLKKPYILSKEDRIISEELMKEIDIKDIKQKAGIIETNEKDPQKIFIDYLFNPTFNISTLKSGFLGEGTKNMVANSALCNVDIRYAHNIAVDDIYNEIRKEVDFFKSKSKCHIELIKNIGYEGSRVDKDSLLVRSLIKSFEELAIHTEIWPLSAAAAPLSKIKKELGINFITGGLGIGGFAHAPNEFVQLASIQNTRLSNFLFLNNYSQSKLR